MKVCSLDQKKCIPCQDGALPLTLEESTKFLQELGGEWSLNQAGHLSKKFIVKNFVQAMDFANKITEIAENEGHHPDLAISWGSCGVEIWTHKINGLTESDFILAAKINALI